MAYTDDLNDEKLFCHWPTYQPMTDLVTWRLEEDQFGYKRTARMILEEMVCLKCTHPTTTRQGKERLSCKTFGKVLEVKERKPQGKPKSEASTSSSSRRAQEHPNGRAGDVEQFQQFLRWQKAQQEAAAPKRQPKRSGK